MGPLLEIRGLRKEFPGESGRPLRAVDDVDLEVKPGESLGLVGESGCGKTTLARCALRLLEPTAGRTLFDGIDLGILSPADLRRKRREFQIIFQDPSAALDPRSTVGQIVAEPFEVHGLGDRKAREKWVRELLDAVALDGSLIHARPGSLSGGQQQRVGIARALALRPRLIVADEPVSALDASVQAQILNLMVDLQTRFSLTLVLISHSLSVVRYLCTRVVVMYLGRIVEDARAGDFFRQPRHPYSQLLLRSVPGQDTGGGSPQTAPFGEIPSPLNPPRGCAFNPRCPQVQPQCRDEAPRLAERAPSGKVACFLCTSEWNQRTNEQQTEEEG
jgi:oligopeptide/dipeptide ABC transporter ATP-binding protein